MAAALTAAFACAQPAAAAPPAGFQETTAFSGLSNPAAISFAPASDGRIFIGEKSGLIKVFDGLGDSSPTTVADLRTEVYNFWDRGLLGMVLDPQFSSGRPYLYALYALDAEPGGSVPRWGSAGVSSDPCPTPPGPTGDGCVVTGRLARLTITGNTMSAKTNLITDWCQQYPSHSTGDLAFGADGALYVSGGDGASFNFTDWGQDGSPVNPCGDPPGGRGSALTPPTAEGGALRSQDARTTGDPTGLDGAILRVDPDTGAGLPGNPFAGSADANQRRIAAIGQRNPFRFTIRPGTDEVWSGDVGWNDWEEINRLVDPSDATADNFGWPCYEGSGRQGSYDGTNLNLCESLYTLGTVSAPYFAYNHAAKVVSGESCPTGSSSISGLDFYQSGPFPDAYDGALFFSDYSRRCIWAMLPGANGLPNPSNIQTFNPGAAGPVDIEISPQGDLFYADLDGGEIRRISSTATPPPPGGDLARGKPTSASSVETTGLEPGMAVDGNSNTRWSSAFADNQWWQVDLGSAQQIDQVRLNWEEAYGSRYLIQTSTDGTNFTQAADVTNNAPGLKTTTFAARSARYVRVHGVTRATPYGFSFWDAEVYGPSGGPANQPPTAVAAANPSSGAAPLSVQLSASGSTDPDDAFGTLSFAWDADNDGQFDDGNGVTLNHTYAAGNHTATVRVTDPDGASDTDSVAIQAGTPPPPTGDLALGKPATASSYETTGFEPGKANDGSSTTRWSSGWADNQWWQVDLGSAQQVSEVKLNWEEAFASRYLIQTSTDGTNFTQAADVTNAAPGVKSTTFAARTARYVRVHGVTRATPPYGFSFWDAEVYGPSGGPANQPPTAVAAANPSSGAAPLSVQLSASGSTDPDDSFGTLSFAWDADNDGQFDDGNGVTLNHTYAAGNHTATVRVTDPDGASDTDAVSIQATAPGNTPPNASITAPAATVLWGVGDTVNFAGSATDAQQTLPATAFDWELIINHCPSNCHQHSVQQFPDRTSGSFVAPDHEYPSSLLIRLTVTDSGGLTDVETVTIDPRTVGLTLASQPAGLQLGLNALTATAPFTRTVIEDSQNTVIAPSPQTLSGTSYTFSAWSDGGAASHNITADQTKTLTATFSAPPASADKALNQPATASSVEAAGLEANKANDGNSSTRFSSGWANNQWWRVDLGRTRQVDRVTVNWEAAYASLYRIQTSTNGTSFSQAAEVTLAGPGVKTTTFPVRSARYVRIFGVTRATPYGFSFWDASVFGPAD